MKKLNTIRLTELTKVTQLVTSGKISSQNSEPGYLITKKKKKFMIPGFH
jgi:hypothetical protein